MRTKNATSKKFVRAFVWFTLASSFWMSRGIRSRAATTRAAAALSRPSSDQAAKDQASKEKSAAEQSAAEQPVQPPPSRSREHQPTSIAGELAKETREAEGEDEQEEHADLKHSTMVQKLAKLTGLSVHGAHLFALILNFAIVAILLVWADSQDCSGHHARAATNPFSRPSKKRAKPARKPASASRTSRIVCVRWTSRSARMQASAEKEAEAEEVRIKKAAEDDLRKVVQCRRTGNRRRRQTSAPRIVVHTADLALALARKQINVDSNTDQVLVRNFAAKLAEPSPEPSPTTE